MPNPSLVAVLRRLRSGTDDDTDLLTRYTADGDAAAFEALVRRHGPMVLGVCRRVLGREADAEDAFQATFLVLARKAAAVRRPAAVGNWLYGVAVNVARRARDADRRRRRTERAVQAVGPGVAGEAWPAADTPVDDELSRLPDKYRLPLVYCGLEGQTMREAAAALGWPHGTVATRLARGRALLARRLARRGIAVPAVLAAATVSETLIARTLVAGPVPAAILSLTTEVIRAMMLTKLKAGAVVLLAAGIGAGLVFAQDAPPAPEKSVAKSAADPLPEAVRVEVVTVQAGRPHRLRLTGSPPRMGSLRVGDDDLLTVSHSPDDPAAVLLTGQKAGTCLLTGQRADGTEASVLVVVSRPYLRLTPKVGETVTLRLPDGRVPVEIRMRKDRPLVGLKMMTVGGKSVTIDDEKNPPWLKLDGAGPDAMSVTADAEGVNQFIVTDDRGLEWQIGVVTTGLLPAAAKP